MPMVTGVAYDLAFQYAMAEAKILARQFCESCGYSEDDQDYWAKCMQDAVAGALPSPTVVRRTNRPPEEPSDG